MRISLQTNAVTSAPTKNNNTPALIPEMTLSFTLAKSAPIFVFFSGSFSDNADRSGGTFSLMVDGQADVHATRRFEGTTGDNCQITMQKRLYLTPGPHTVEVWWQNNGAGTITGYLLSRSMTLYEEEIE
jgi:hypothetical protein